jgi:hypothetical protein
MAQQNQNNPVNRIRAVMAKAASREISRTAGSEADSRVHRRLTTASVSQAKSNKEAASQDNRVISETIRRTETAVRTGNVRRGEPEVTQVRPPSSYSHKVVDDRREQQLPAGRY